MRVLTWEAFTGPALPGQPLWSPWSSSTPQVVYQSGASTECPLYLGLDRALLNRYVQALTRAWRLVGLGPGDRVSLFDFGSSPLVFLASAFYTPYLGRGAAEHLGCTPICNDGEPTMGSRALDILRFVNPRVMFIRRDCVPSWLQDVETRAFPVSTHLSRLVVADDEAVLSERQRGDLEEKLKLPVVRLLRVDLAFFLAAECPDCRAFHTWDDLYRVNILDEETQTPLSFGEVGLLATAPRFGRRRKERPIYLSRVRARQASPGCPRGASDLRLEVLS